MLKTSLPVKVLLWNFNQEAIAMPENINYLEKVDAMVGLRGLTKGTHTYYLSMCRRFLNWCDTMSIDPGEISYEQVQQYVFHLIRDVKYAPKTVNSNISFIRFFFLYVLHRPIDRYWLPYQRVDRRPPEILSEKEVFQFINALPNLKDKAIITLLYSCGLRISEVVSLQYKDISRERMMVYIEHTKNHSARYVPLSEKALNVLTEYWRAWGKPKEWLFPGKKPDTHLSTNSVFSVIKDTRDRLGWQNKRITSHTFRHCMGTHMYEAGYDLRYIQTFMGHKSINSTTIYVTLTGKRGYKNLMDSMDGEIEV